MAFLKRSSEARSPEEEFINMIKHEDTCFGRNMAEVASSGCQSLPYEVVFWDSEAPEYGGDRISYSESLVLDTSGQARRSGWRSDRRCQFPVEVGLHLSRPCRLQQVVVVSESRLAPSAIECFVAGPTRARLRTEKRGEKWAPKPSSWADPWQHNGSTKDSTDAARAGYLSSMFVRIGLANFSNRVDGLQQGSVKRSLPPGMSLAVLSGLSFKGRFLRLVIWEAAGSQDNPGRQVKATATCAAVKEEARRAGDTSLNVGGSHAAAFSDEVGDGNDREETMELEQVLVGLGIEPNLLAGHGQLRNAGVQGREGGQAATAAAGGGSREQRERRDAWCGVVEEATSRLRGMLQVAHAQERFNEAERLSIALNRVRSLAASVCSARRAQHNASRREQFDEAKRCRDRAMEAETWVRQTVREASEMFQDGATGAADASSRPTSSPTALTSAASAGQTIKDGKSAAGDSFNTITNHTEAKPSPEDEEEASAPFHDSGKNHPPGRERRQGDLDESDSTEGIGDVSKVRDVDDKNKVSPPWLDPTCSRCTGPWKGVLPTLPWPRGVRPDFRTVFSHGSEGWTPSPLAARDDKPSGKTTTKAKAETQQLNHILASRAGVRPAAPGHGRSGRGGKAGGGGLSTRRFSQQPDGLLRTVLRLVAASQDLRPPGPVPPDVAPFRRASRADRRPPLCTFFYTSVPGSVSSKMSLKEILAYIQDTSDAADHGNRNEQDGRFGRAFAQPTADATPSATAVVNWVEDNPRLAWGSPLALCFPFIASQQTRCDSSRHRSRHLSQDGFGAEGKSAAAVAGEGKGDNLPGGKESADGETERDPVEAGDAAVDASAGDHDDAADKTSGRKRDSYQSDRGPGNLSSSGVRTAHEGTSDGTESPSRAVEGAGSEAVQAATTAATEPEEASYEEASGGPAQIAASFLPDIVGAGGFSEFVPLLEAIIGRVPMAAACAGVPAKMRESAIRICQVNLDRTADVAVEACNTAAAPTDTSSARGAVFRATCLVAAQGLMDPADEPRLAAESLAKSVISLWSGEAEAVGEGKGAAQDEDGEQAGKEGRFRAPMIAEAARPVVALPLRDLRWGLELVLACVAPYLANGIPEVADKDREDEDQPPTTPKARDKPESFDDSEQFCSSIAFSADDSRTLDPASPEEHAPGTDDNAALGGATMGQADGNGGTQSLKDDTARKRESDAQEVVGAWQRRSALPRCPIQVNRGGDNSCEERRSYLALRLVDYACRQPDIGPALVSSILVSWIPFLLRLRVMASSPAHLDSTAGGRKATGSGGGTIGARSGSSAISGPAGEMAASEALASGAIHMLAFMVRTFPLLPLSDFAAEALASAAEGGMVFEAGHTTPCSSGRAAMNVPKHKRKGAAGSAYVRRSSTSGRARHAGETLMLELFLCARTSGGSGEQLDFLNDLLPALNTSRGINFVHETSASLFAGTTGGGTGQKETKSRGGSVGQRGGQRGEKAGEDRYTTRAAVAGGAAKNFGVTATSNTSAVEIRKRLPVPITKQPPTEAAALEGTRSNMNENAPIMPPTRDDEDGVGGSGHHSIVPPMSGNEDHDDSDDHRLVGQQMPNEQDSDDGDGLHSTARPMPDDENNGGSNGHHLPRGETTNVGEYPQMSDSSSAGFDLLSASNSSETMGSLQSIEEGVTSVVAGGDTAQALSGESRRANKVFPLSDGLGRGTGPAGNGMESRSGVSQEQPVVAGEAAASGTEGEKIREESTGLKKDKKSGGGFISRLFRRGKT